jgi:methanogenic corrinoid protein MtbC1
LNKALTKGTSTSVKVLAVGEILRDLLPSGKPLGGAPVTEEFANEIGADSYAPTPPTR